MPQARASSATSVLEPPATKTLPPASAAVQAPPRPPHPATAPPLQQDAGTSSSTSPAALQQQPQQQSQQQQQQQQQQDSSQVSAAAAPAVLRTCSRYMCYFLHRLMEFREPELRALAGMHGIQQLEVEPIPPDAMYDGGDMWPFRMVHLPDDAVAARIAERSVLIKGMFDVWGEGATFEEMLAAVASHPAALKAPHLAPGASFKLILSTVGFKWRPEQHQQYVHRAVEAVGFEGEIRLQRPDNTFWVVTVRSDGEAGMPPMPTRWVFGREIALGDRSFLGQYALPQRAYIGPTSMDPELAFLMTNMAQVTPRSLVMDPYVGTGSILVAAAARGAATIGGDIDHRVVMAGKSHPKTGAKLTVFSNYEQYGLQWPVGLIRMDVHRHPFRRGLTEVLDAILGDPPYGVRAGGRKSKRNPEARIMNRATYIPSTAPYTLTECLTDLLEFAAVMLVVGGRLVFWMPSNPELYSPEELPTHPMLQLLHNSEQILTSRYSRRLITMVKVKPYDADAAAAFKQERQDYVMALDRLSELVYYDKEATKAAAAAAAAGPPPAAGDGSSEAGEQQQQQRGRQQLNLMPSGMPRYRGKNL